MPRKPASSPPLRRLRVHSPCSGIDQLRSLSRGRPGLSGLRRVRMPHCGVERSDRSCAIRAPHCARPSSRPTSEGEPLFPAREDSGLPLHAIRTLQSGFDSWEMTGEHDIMSSGFRSIR